jgi:hypothetical protein
LKIESRVWSGVSAAATLNWRNVVAFLTLSVAAAFTAYIVLSGTTFWDFAVYRAGISAYRAIGTPYDPEYLHQVYGLGLPFTYAPMVLLAFTKVSWLFTSGPGLTLLLSVHLAACLSIPWLMVPRDLRRTELVWMSGVFLTAFGLSGTKLFLTGNLAAVASALVLAALRYCIPRRNYTVLFLLLLLVCQVKIYFICFGAVPFLMDRKVWIPAAACLLIVATYALNYLMPPLLVHGFVTSLQAVSQVTAFVGTSVLTAVQISLGRLAVGHGTLVVLISWGAHCLYALLLLGFAASVMWTRARPVASPYLASLWAFMAALLISPRLAPYELALLVIPFLIFIQRLLAARDLGLGIAIAGFIAGASLVTTPLADWGGFVALLGVWVGIGVSWLRAAAAAPQAVLS